MSWQDQEPAKRFQQVLDPLSTESGSNPSGCTQSEDPSPVSAARRRLDIVCLVNTKVI